jgi:membrane fusion protein (multidrug efflux system)
MGIVPPTGHVAVVEGVVVVRLVSGKEGVMKQPILGLLVLALACSACNSAKEASVAAAAPAPAAAMPTASPASASTPAPTFVASGPIVVENQVDVDALREGVVVSILAQPGAMVRKGQLLAKLDDRQISADLEAAAARVRALEANLENWHAETKVLQADRSRAEKLYEAKVIPKEQLEHAVYKEEADEFEIKRESESLNNAKSVRLSLELEKEKTNITAPFDGIVARRYVRAGQKVSIGDRLFWVTALGPLEVKFTLPERFFGKVHQGEQVEVSSNDVSQGTRYTAKIVQVSPVIDPSSGTMEVLAQIAGTNSDLRPGMLVNISLNQHP